MITCISPATTLRCLAAACTALLLLGVNQAASAVYIYPRPTLRAAVDLESDGRVDFELRNGQVLPGKFPVCFQILPVDGTGVYGLSGCQILTGGVECMPDIRPLETGTVLGPGKHPETHWVAGGEAYSVQTIPGGSSNSWGPLTTRSRMFVGIRVPDASGYRYGWMELAVPSPGALPDVVGFAFESRAETAVTAGIVPPPGPVGTEVPIRAPDDQRILAGVRNEASTNSTTGVVTLQLGLVSPPTLRVLSRTGTSGREPCIVAPGSVLTSPLPVGWAWTTASGEPLLLRRREVAASGGTLTDVGPLAQDGRGIVALQTSDGQVFWVELNGDGSVGRVGWTRATDPKLLVGQPFVAPGAPIAYLDLDGDGRVEFLLNRHTEYFTGPGGDPRTPWSDNTWWLIPLPGAAILTPTTLPLAGVEVSETPPGGGAWGTSNAKLLWLRTSVDSFYGSFTSIGELLVLRGEAGFVGVRFPAADGVRYGWIRFNQHSLWTGRVVAGRAIYVHEFDLVDFGHGDRAGASVRAGERSSFPLRIRATTGAGQVRLDWDPVASKARLESARAVTGGEWSPVPTGNGSNAMLPLPEDGLPIYFRLQLPAVYPAERQVAAGGPTHP